MISARALVRNIAELGLTAGGAARRARRLNCQSIAVLAYHNVVSGADAGLGDASLHLPLPAFIAQIDRLVQTHEIIDLDDMPDDAAAGRPRAVITFDDAYRGAVRFALPELARRRIPATMFVAPGLLGAHSTWWDSLAAAGHLSTEQREAFLTDLGGRGDVIMDRAFMRTTLPSLPPDYRIATHEELLAACGPTVSIGSHSWGHEYLPALDSDPLRTTLQSARAWVAEHPGRRSEWLALPYGGGSETVTRTALALGYRGVLRINGGMWEASSDAVSVPRINVPAGMSVRGLELRASGVLSR